MQINHRMQQKNYSYYYCLDENKERKEKGKRITREGKLCTCYLLVSLRSPRIP